MFPTPIIMYLKIHKPIDPCRLRISSIIQPHSSSHGKILLAFNALATGYGAEFVDGAVIAYALDLLVVGLNRVDGHPGRTAGGDGVSRLEGRCTADLYA